MEPFLEELRNSGWRLWMTRELVSSTGRVSSSPQELLCQTPFPPVEWHVRRSRLYPPFSLLRGDERRIAAAVIDTICRPVIPPFMRPAIAAIAAPVRQDAITRTMDSHLKRISPNVLEFRVCGRILRLPHCIRRIPQVGIVLLWTSLTLSPGHLAPAAE